MFRFICCTYPVFKFGFIRSSAVWRVAAGVSAGLAGCAGSGGAVPMRVALPEVELGNSVTPWENPGVAPSIELVAAPTMRSLKSEEHTSELQSLRHLVCRLLLEKKKN